MYEDNFLDLVKKNKGFQICLSFIDNEDHFIGGTNDKVWYYIQKGSKEECWLATIKKGKWTDNHYIKKGKKFTKLEEKSGTTIAKITERLYFGQDEIAKNSRKPVTTEKYEFKLDHYTYNFGEIAYDISQDYGVTVSYSNINDTKVGFSFRSIYTGDDVKAPEF